MKTTEVQNEQRPGILESWRRMLGKMFSGNARSENRVSDDDIRRSLGGMSATTTYQKPGKKAE